MGVRDRTVLDPPVLAEGFRRVTRGCAERYGYRFRIDLPGPKGILVPERDGGGFGASQTDPDLAEERWWAYAWPVQGEGRTFFTSEAGDILEAPAGAYSGDREPTPDAALHDGRAWQRAG